VLIGIDHLVISVADPDAAADDLATRLGVEAGGGGRHDRLGTFNRLIWLGDSYLELIGVFDRDLAADAWIGAPTLRALERGGGFATFALASDAIDHDVARLRERGSDLAPPVPGERTRPDGRVVRWQLAAPPRLDPDRPPFLIQHDPTGAEWAPEDREARALGAARLTVLELAVDDVNRTSQAWLRSVGLRFRPSLAGGGARDADVGRQLVRLRPRRPVRGGGHAAAGHAAAGHAAADPAEVSVHLAIAGADAYDEEALGVRWRVVPRPD
jgi:hypothetical protein